MPSTWWKNGLVWLIWSVLTFLVTFMLIWLILGQIWSKFDPQAPLLDTFMQISYSLPSTKWKHRLFCLFQSSYNRFGSTYLVAPVADGFWPLAPADAGQPPLFLASMDCFRSILGPRLKSYLGIIFFLLTLGMNLASTYCVG